MRLPFVSRLTPKWKQNGGRCRLCTTHGLGRGGGLDVRRAKDAGSKARKAKAQHAILRLEGLTLPGPRETWQDIRHSKRRGVTCNEDPCVWCLG